MWARALGQEKPWGREWQPPPVFLPGKSQDRGARRALAHEAAKSRSRLSTDEYTHTHTRAHTHTEEPHTDTHVQQYCLTSGNVHAARTHALAAVCRPPGGGQEWTQGGGGAAAAPSGGASGRRQCCLLVRRG